MNNVQKELEKVAGDMTASKERVKKRIRQHRQGRGKKPIRFSLLTAILTICLVGFMLVQLVTKDTEQGTALFHETQLEHFEKISHTMWPRQDEAFYKNEAYRSYEKLVASYYFGKSLGLHYTKADLEAERKKHLEELKMLQQVPDFAALFQGLKPAQYVETYLEPLLPMYVVRTKLYALYKEKYPTFRPFQEVADIEASHYFQAQFAEQATKFQEANDIEMAMGLHGSSKVGTVAQVEENTFLFVEGVIPTDIARLSKKEVMQQYKEANWYPVLSDFSIAKGDYITLHSIGTHIMESDGVVAKYGLLDSMEVLDANVTKQLEVQNEQEIAQILQGMDWQPTEHIGRPPDYSFILEGMRIEIWKGYGGLLYLQKVGSGEIQLRGEKSTQLKTLLGIKEA
ncbi:hypothetical protein I6G82_09300 [Lysinibacillus macroides]|uniref:Uncharacterized protein n=1 Tax=Lysinibacillus macroides TaxID=33935 RepID=A0A0M9DGU9_9BACI|nr:hypothetical protein [Lysinibacillus macroides]KOY80619.1 hypothetical protein ADM90_15550 [Lysinibacillus macroides]QPR69757.1 hypothetical protein I6G82_09300 [Lysinibacillus macroides]